jgi:hypothetical protein
VAVEHGHLDVAEYSALSDDAAKSSPRVESAIVGGPNCEIGSEIEGAFEHVIPVGASIELEPRTRFGRDDGKLFASFAQTPRPESRLAIFERASVAPWIGGAHIAAHVPGLTQQPQRHCTVGARGHGTHDLGPTPTSDGEVRPCATQSFGTQPVDDAHRRLVHGDDHAPQPHTPSCRGRKRRRSDASMVEGTTFEKPIRPLPRRWIPNRGRDSARWGSCDLGRQRDQARGASRVPQIRTTKLCARPLGC